jgi:hypothetical protein
MPPVEITELDALTLLVVVDNEARRKGTSSSITCASPATGSRY